MSSDEMHTDESGAESTLTVSRRGLLKRVGAGAAGLGLGRLGGMTDLVQGQQSGQQLLVRVKNVSTVGTLETSEGDKATALSPGVYAVHDTGKPFFGGLTEASKGVEALAEDGRPGALASEVQGRDSIVESGVFGLKETVADPNQPAGGPAPPIFPGGAFEFTVSATRGQSLSLATMFVPYNNIFFRPGAERIRLFEGGTPAGDVTDAISLWDAGTEPNGQPGYGPDQAPHRIVPTRVLSSARWVRSTVATPTLLSKTRSR